MTTDPYTDADATLDRVAEHHGGPAVGASDRSFPTAFHLPEWQWPNDRIPDPAADAVAELLAALGIQSDDHTAETPVRAAKAWREMLWGYREDPSEHLTKTFSAPANPGLVIQHGITLHSTCAHHLLPFSGHATVAYRPSPTQPIVGLSKLARTIRGYAARLQVQERIGAETVDAIVDRLHPAGAMVLITASHDCMRLRGVAEPCSSTTTMANAGLLTPEEIQLIHRMHGAG